MVSVALYNLTPGRGLTQPWCEPSPWSDQSRWAAHIPCMASAKYLSSLCFCHSQFYTLVWWSKSVIKGDILSISTSSSHGDDLSGNWTQAACIQAMLANHYTTTAHINEGSHLCKGVIACIQHICLWSKNYLPQ